MQTEDGEAEDVGNNDIVAGAVLPSSPQIRCDAMGCVYRHGDYKVAFAALPAALLEDCGIADILVAAVCLRDCKAKTVIDEPGLWRQGARALTFQADGVKVDSVRAQRGLRPWSPGWQKTQKHSEN